MNQSHQAATGGNQKRYYAPAGTTIQHRGQSCGPKQARQNEAVAQAAQRLQQNGASFLRRLPAEYLRVNTTTRKANTGTMAKAIAA